MRFAGLIFWVGLFSRGEGGGGLRYLMDGENVGFITSVTRVGQRKTSEFPPPPQELNP